MGKLMLQDLMKAVGNIYDDRNAIKHPTTLIIDEFASFATPDFGEFIEKAQQANEIARLQNLIIEKERAIESLEIKNKDLNDRNRELS